MVGRPPHPPLEGADVTERAAVDAAHVRLQRPLEHHPAHTVQRTPPRLLAVLRGHALQHSERTFGAGTAVPVPILRADRWLGRPAQYTRPGDRGVTLFLELIAVAALI